MHTANNELIFSATDLSNFLACKHLSILAHITALGGPKPPKYDDPGLEVLWQRGIEHEQDFLQGLKSEGLCVTEIPDPPVETPAPEKWIEGAQATLAAMRSGVDVIYQGILFEAPWLGKPDFLRRVDLPSDLGSWSYEVVDTKLAREAKAGAVLQIALYSDLLARAQGTEPEWMTLALGGPDRHPERFRVADFAAYHRFVRRRFLETMDSAPDSPPVAPEPCDRCSICAWKSRCDGERRQVDHLSLVAGITRKQRGALQGREIGTVAELAELPLPVRPQLDGVSDTAMTRVREQARIQIVGRKAEKPRYELLTPVVEEQGLAALPAPSPGDLFFDFEGDPYAFDKGLEYLFGWVDAEGEYMARWALDLDREKTEFEAFIDFVMNRLQEYPDLHIYHYASYETTAMKRLMGWHGTREDEVDQFLRGGVFVDLHRVVRQGLRASVESYSIKKMEPFYGYGRDVDLRQASAALAHFTAWLEMGKRGEGDAALLEEVEGYNRDDCLSTLRLRDWLEERRAELAALVGRPIPRPSPPEPTAPDEVPEHLVRVTELVEELTDDVPADPGERSPDQQGRWLLAQLLNWHRREKKSTWWQYFSWLELTDEELIEDRSTLGGLEYVEVVDQVKRSYVHRYRFPRQEHDIKRGSRPRDPGTDDDAGEVYAVDDVAGTIDLKRGVKKEVPHPKALLPLDNINDRWHRQSLERIAKATIEHGLTDRNPFRAAVELLLRDPPRVGQHEGDVLRAQDEPLMGAAKGIVSALDGSVLPVQGPPGSGKTYLGARLMMHLLQQGKRVGVCSTSHKVIGNLLDATCAAAAEVGYDLRGLQKANADQTCDCEQIERASNNAAVRDALAEGEVRLAAGTAWLWSTEDMIGAVDVLFIDEAGQFSLANTLAVSPAARSLVLLGDPRQLDQPQRGVHPPGAEASALGHLLGEEATISPDRGLFLEETWRLHPAITAFTSEVFYRGRLGSHSGLDIQTIAEGGPATGAGLGHVEVAHSGNRSESPEEVAAVLELFEGLIRTAPEWTDRDGNARPLGLRDILVIAPYNAQVTALKEALPEDARVGTVDKFQGQEAAVAIYSMASSSAEEAPRGMDFLYSPNRLNVATSRAKCMSVLVSSPALFEVECRSPKQMRLANALCRFSEMSGVVTYGAWAGT